MHLGVYLFNIGAWAVFSSVVLKVYSDDDNNNAWYLTFITFECGIFANAVLITSIIYAIYWLHKTGEMIERKRLMYNKTKEAEIDYTLAEIEEKNKRTGSNIGREDY